MGVPPLETKVNQGKEQSYFGDNGDLDNSSDSGGSLDDIYNEKMFTKKPGFKKQPGFDFEGF